MKFRIPLVIFSLVLLILGGCSPDKSGNYELKNPAGANSMYPYLYSTGDHLYMSWISSQGNTELLNYARYNGEKWSAPRTIESDSTWFVNWADYPSIIADADGPIAAHWLNKKPGGTYAYDVNIAAAGNEENWESVLTPHKDSTATEHGFVSMVPWKNGGFLAVWLDGRQTANRADDEYYDINYAMTLRGALISSEGDILDTFLIDDSVCDCCQTSLTKTDSGAVVAYRNRTDNEIRDIYVSRFNGNSWSQPQAVHSDGWKIGACPVNGPKIVSEGNRVAVAWFTGADDSSRVKMATSTDGGHSFSKPIQMNKNRSLGRVDAAINGSTIFVSWIEKVGGKGLLKAGSVENHELRSTHRIGPINPSRSSGFPQMESFNNRLIFAWTKVDSASKSLISKQLPLPLR